MLILLGECYLSFHSVIWDKLTEKCGKRFSKRVPQEREQNKAHSELCIRNGALTFFSGAFTKVSYRAIGSLQARHRCFL